MCTAVTYKTKDHYFGRTLDLEYGYGEKVVVTPRNFPLHFGDKGTMKTHYAIIGMATVVADYPLYYEAANEHGLAVAGLNFPGNAHYFEDVGDRDNIAPFEFAPWILGQCKNLTQARELLGHINICNRSFSEKLPLSPLHWIIADKNGAITVESVAEGLKIYENPIGVLTNNPPFDYHMTHLGQYLNVTAYEAQNRFSEFELIPFSKGMGGIGLPGDLSSASRFVRAAFVKLNSLSEMGENESISQFFHILGAVDQQRGCVRLPDGSLEITRYTSCINTDRGIYYYTTYDNRSISAVDMHRCDLDATVLHQYSLQKEQKIYWQN